jgi:integrase/recombinase XerD
LWLGIAARIFCPAGHAWFVQSCERLSTHPGDVALQWNTLAKVTAMTGTTPDQIHRSTEIRSNRLLIERNRPVTAHRIAKILRQQAADAGIGHVTAHQLRHTLATQAINRGMSLDAIAALLGHKTLAMTMVYARIADKTVANEYFAVTEKVEALYDKPRQLPSADEGTEMRKLRSEMHRRMLGNGYCARPVEMDCYFESICESCTFFVTTLDFRPTLQLQRDDAARKGQVGRQKIFDGLLARLDEQVS